jgi:arabinofuranosyltransferase
MPEAAPADSAPAGRVSNRWPSHRLALAALLLIATLFALRFRDHTSDDAYITFRYALNLVQGHGLVYNPGDRVEGYTNFLWVLVAAVPIALGIDPLPVARFIGLLAQLAVVLCVARAATRFAAGTASRAAPALAVGLLVALSPTLAVWATAGLETSLFCALVTWGVWLVAEGLEAGHLPLAAAFLLGAAALTRPEGILVGMVVSAVTAPARFRPDVSSRRWILVTGTIAIVVATYWAWRTWYYLALLPNTFQAKVGATGAQALRGLDYTRDFLLECGSWTVVALACGVVLARRRPAVRVVTAVALVYAAYVVAIGGDALPMFRFFAPFVCLAALLAAETVGAFIAGRGRAGGEPGPGRRRAALLSAVVAAWAIACAWPGFFGRSYDYVQQDRREVEAWRQIGAWFRGHADPGESIAVVPAGVLPYTSGLVAIDMLGITDRVIAQHPIDGMGTAPAGHERSDPGAILARRPTYVLLGVYELAAERPAADATVPLYYRAERELAQSPDFEAHYRPITGRCPGGYFTFFARDDKVFPEVWPRPQPSGQ